MLIQVKHEFANNKNKNTLYKQKVKKPPSRTNCGDTTISLKETMGAQNLINLQENREKQVHRFDPTTKNGPFLQGYKNYQPKQCTSY